MSSSPVRTLSVLLAYSFRGEDIADMTVAEWTRLYQKITEFVDVKPVCAEGFRHDAAAMMSVQAAKIRGLAARYRGENEGLIQSISFAIYIALHRCFEAADLLPQEVLAKAKLHHVPCLREWTALHHAGILEIADVMSPTRVSPSV